MNETRSFFASSVGRKVIMALTGLVLFLFVVGHMLGNLQIYMGAHQLQAYADKLHAIPALLWAVRAFLFTCAALHVWAATVLTFTNMAARAQAYREKANLETSFSSLTMRWTGYGMLAFITYHVLHLTVGVPGLHPDFSHASVYHNVVSGLGHPVAAVIYLVAMAALGLHMYHGGWSMLQTLGLSHPRYDRWRYPVAAVVATVVVAANLSFLVAARLLPPPSRLARSVASLVLAR